MMGVGFRGESVYEEECTKLIYSCSRGRKEFLHQRSAMLWIGSWRAKYTRVRVSQHITTQQKGFDLGSEAQRSSRGPTYQKCRTQ